MPRILPALALALVSQTAAADGMQPTPQVPQAVLEQTAGPFSSGTLVTVLLLVALAFALGESSDSDPQTDD